MREKFLSLIDRTLNTRITPLAYLVTIYSFIFGGSFVFLDSLTSVRVTLLYRYDALIGAPVWGMFVFVASAVLLAGLLIKRVSLVQAGALGLFCGWLFAAITYAQNDLWLQMVLAIVFMLCFGYHFLASSLGRLWDYTP
jgi:hypothetical protein